MTVTAAQHDLIRYYWGMKGPQPKNAAEELGAYFEDLRTRLNVEELQAEHLVSDARRKRSVLRKEFEWDDAKAAHEHRLEKARWLLRGVRGVWRLPDGTEVEGRVAVHIKRHTVEESGVRRICSGGYYRTESVVAYPERRDIALQDALRSLEAFRRKFHFILKLAGLDATLDLLMTQIRMRIEEGKEK
jgi:hypothetical protein